MEYPADFPNSARAKVEAEEIRASLEFDQAVESAQWRSAKENCLRSYILRVFLVFVNEACSRQLWAIDKTRRICEEFLRLLTIEGCYSKGLPRGLSKMTGDSGYILTKVQTEFEDTPEWRLYRKALLQLADNQAEKSEAQAATPESSSLSPQLTQSPAQAPFAEQIRRRGPRPAMERHRKIAEVVKPYGNTWKDHLDDIAEALDSQKIETPEKWARLSRPAKSWERAVICCRERVIKVIEYALRKAVKENPEKLSETLGNSR